MKRVHLCRCRLAVVRAFVVVLLVAALPLSAVRAATEEARVVKYSKEDIVPVRAKLRFSTLIVLPEDEEILDFTTGDKEFWIINGAHNLCYVHPAQAGIRSNLNLITASGHVYSFLLTEISSEPGAEPDLKIFVEPKEA
ncbi:MAG: TrbG/VirB9 family P-type conjugative transfer protein, partial [Candidatus Acidiferrales bacterium]